MVNSQALYQRCRSVVFSQLVCGNRRQAAQRSSGGVNEVRSRGISVDLFQRRPGIEIASSKPGGERGDVDVDVLPRHRAAQQDPRPLRPPDGIDEVVVPRGKLCLSMVGQPSPPRGWPDWLRAARRARLVAPRPGPRDPSTASSEMIAGPGRPAPSVPASPEAPGPSRARVMLPRCPPVRCTSVASARAGLPAPVRRAGQRRPRAR